LIAALKRCATQKLWLPEISGHPRSLAIQNLWAPKGSARFRNSGSPKTLDRPKFRVAQNSGPPQNLCRSAAGRKMGEGQIWERREIPALAKYGVENWSEETRLKPETESEFEAAVVARLTRSLVPFLFLLYTVAYLDRLNVGFAALEMQRQLHFDDRVYGLGAGMFFAGYFFFQLPSNLMLERVGARKWIALLMVVWGVVSSCMIFVSSARSFYVLRFLLGASEAGFFPGIILYLKGWFPARARGKTVAQFMTAGPIAGVVGGPIAGVLLGYHGGWLMGWQWLFLLEGLPAMVLGAVVVFYLTDRPVDARWLTAEQRAWLADTLRREQQAASVAVRGGAFAALASGPIWMLAFVYFGVNTCSYGISLWLPKVIHSLSGVSNVVIGLLSAIPYLAAAIVMVVVGLHSDRSGERRWHVAGCAFGGAIGLVGAAYSGSLVPVIVGIGLGYLAVSSMAGPFWAMATERMTGIAAGAGIALINSIGNLGGFFGPYTIGLVRSHSGQFRGGLLVLSVTLCLAGMVTLVVAKAGRGLRKPDL
jgi:ACS family tartrate transporter-like MFS transporter